MCTRAIFDAVLYFMIGVCIGRVTVVMVRELCALEYMCARACVCGGGTGIVCV